MDIPMLSMVMSQNQVKTSASVAMIKLAMDTSKETAALLTESISQGDSSAAEFGLGVNIDVLV